MVPLRTLADSYIFHPTSSKFRISGEVDAKGLQEDTGNHLILEKCCAWVAAGSMAL